MGGEVSTISSPDKSDIQALTARMACEHLQHIGCLTRCPLGFIQHVEEEAKLAEKTLLAQAGSSRVLERQIPQDGGEVHDLQEAVGVRIGDVVLQARISSPVVESATSCELFFLWETYRS